MSFIWPVMLISLILVPLAAVLYLRALRRRRLQARQFSGFGLASAAAQQGPRWRQYLPPILFLVSLTILAVALARPQMVINLPRIEGTVILAFDVSGSMAADDLKPNRIEAAKAAARDFVARQPRSVAVGVVAFSDNGFSVQPPTTESDAILAAINRLTPQRGTSLANGIAASLNTIAASRAQKLVGDTEGEPAHLTDRTPEPTPTPTAAPPGSDQSTVIVLLTDGENNERPDPLAAAQAAADRGVRIYTVGIGSAAGTNLHVEGFTVNTRLDEAMLQQIAQITHGEYYNAEDEKQLLAVYDSLNPELLLKPQKTEVTAVFAGAGILFLLVGGLYSLWWFSRIL